MMMYNLLSSYNYEINTIRFNSLKLIYLTFFFAETSLVAKLNSVCINYSNTILPSPY